ncbi:MAG TPA: hypothetical protein ENN80_15340 [Candidatus Hydrogenedentes bacterium]|nr:hypothetical protein [Candidatus Hydrogenedentota bacterium]
MDVEMDDRGVFSGMCGNYYYVMTFDLVGSYFQHQPSYYKDTPVYGRLNLEGGQGYYLRLKGDPQEYDVSVSFNEDHTVMYINIYGIIEGKTVRSVLYKQK